MVRIIHKSKRTFFKTVILLKVKTNRIFLENWLEQLKLCRSWSVVIIEKSGWTFWKITFATNDVGRLSILLCSLFFLQQNSLLVVLNAWVDQLVL